MNKRSKNIIGYLIMCMFGIAIVLVVYHIDQHKETPEKRIEKQVVSNTENKAKGSTEGTKEVMEAAPEKSNIIHTMDLDYELESYEIVDDTKIESQTTYTANYFRDNRIPDADYKDEYIDYEAIEKVCPELRDMWENDTKYSVEETKEIYNRNLKIIEKYTTKKHPKTRYVFVKCKITNNNNHKYDGCFDLRTYVTSKQSELIDYQENLIYFDKAQNLEGEARIHKFFWYCFDENETLECTLGFEIKEAFGPNEEYYIGLPPISDDPVNPKESKTIVGVNSLGGNH